MTKEERKEKIAGLRKRLSSVTEEEKAVIAQNCVVVTVEGHTLSPINTMMVYFQSSGMETPTVVGGFNQWKKAGRIVRKGEHGFTIWIPRIQKVDDGSDEESGEEQIGFLTGTIFDISQTEVLQ